MKMLALSLQSLLHCKQNSLLLEPTHQMLSLIHILNLQHIHLLPDAYNTHSPAQTPRSVKRIPYPVSYTHLDVYKRQQQENELHDGQKDLFFKIRPGLL